MEPGNARTAPRTFRKTGRKNSPALFQKPPHLTRQHLGVSGLARPNDQNAPAELAKSNRCRIPVAAERRFRAPRLIFFRRLSSQDLPCWKFSGCSGLRGPGNRDLPSWVILHATVSNTHRPQEENPGGYPDVHHECRPDPDPRSDAEKGLRAVVRCAACGNLIKRDAVPIPEEQIDARRASKTSFRPTKRARVRND